MIVIGCWWLLREVELSNASVGDVTFTSKGKPQLLLPVSKADASALGEMRSHECACETNVSNQGYLQNNICPACTLAAQASDVRKEFPALGDKALVIMLALLYRVRQRAQTNLLKLLIFRGSALTDRRIG
jgi:hypothetical protein